MFVWRNSANSKLLGCILLALALVSACARPGVSPQNARRTLTDGLGRTVSVVAKPQRIISLAPNITEILFAVGLGDHVVGVTSYCDFPAAAQTKEKIGDTLHPNLERIIALKPDLVLVTTSSQLETLTRQLDQLQIPVYITNPRTVRDVIASIRTLGEVIAAERAAIELADEMARRLSAVETRVGALPKPSVLYVLQTAPLITAGRNTFINDLITLAGGRSIAAEETTDYPQFSREAVIARAPEIILAPESHGAELVREADLRRDFAATPAVRNQRIARVNADWVDRPGPRIVEGLEQLAQALHPPSP
ncbi:MAG: ABC transporter substrate-binding protein [Acidobacteria bacterium]|nr:ABC transporter substrate-binding protein [Acidobacteriota bacterium]